MADRNIIRFDGLAKNRPFSVALKVEPADTEHLRRELNAISVTKLRFEGELTPYKRRGWQLNGQMGATVTQECVVTAKPVSTRVDQNILRKYSPDVFDEYESGSENEMPDDDTLDPLPETLDILDVVLESLSLALPDYPRAKDAALSKTVFTEPGIAPLTDEAAKPFAGLAALRDRLETKD